MTGVCRFDGSWASGTALAPDDVLWEVNVGSAVTGFRGSHAVNGRQYMAVGHRQRGYRVGVHTPDP